MPLRICCLSEPVVVAGCTSPQQACQNHRTASQNFGEADGPTAALGAVIVAGCTSQQQTKKFLGISCLSESVVVAGCTSPQQACQHLESVTQKFGEPGSQQNWNSPCAATLLTLRCHCRRMCIATTDKEIPITATSVPNWRECFRRLWRARWPAK